eukprot:NODE_4532_length_791_cov_17.505391_g3765_i0.p2 GENE.NODE_4532_length_791_cov_17.505391_g3765_i0~~NODE_4532_length_791_cov_17.505391_g3765_i0.p2  ORF type:complete len:64 (-),score=4.58 NODE_4532_length_791_cov_17.505391_g3765_i0:9-200(-)
MIASGLGPPLGVEASVNDAVGTAVVNSYSSTGRTTLPYSRRPPPDSLTLNTSTNYAPSCSVVG